jgi:hypothetical protein
LEFNDAPGDTRRKLKVILPSGDDMPKKTDKKLVRVLRDAEKLLSLREIRLLESHCKLGHLQEGDLPPTATHEVNLIAIGGKVPVFEPNEPNSQTGFALIDFRLTAPYDDIDGHEPLLLSARFALHYTVSRLTSQKILGEIVEAVAVQHAWPFWREFVQSMTVRMGLPPFPIPLMSPSHLVKTASSAGNLEER